MRQQPQDLTLSATMAILPGSPASAQSWETGSSSAPADPFEVTFCDTPGYARGVAVSGSLAYVANGDGGHFILPHLLPEYQVCPPLVLRDHP